MREEYNNMNERNYGIDLLRIVSMYGVVILHIISIGGVIENTEFLSIQHNIIYCLYVAVICSVNCYALISGYVGYTGKFKIENLIGLWLRVVFYSVVGTIVIALIVAPNNIQPKDIVLSFFPVLNNSYWYFTAYFVVFFFKPILDMGIEKIDNIILKRILLILIIAVSSSNIISKDKDIFKLGDGYSALWLIILYILGAYLRKTNCFENTSKKRLCLGYIVAVAVTAAFGIGAGLVSNKFVGRTIGFNCFNTYTSPTVVLEAIFLTILFSKIVILNEKHIKIIKKFAASSFSVYLIHIHPFVKEYLLKDRMVWIANKPVVLNVIIIMGCALVICGVCYMIDFVRSFLVKKISKCKTLIKQND